jgi:hypothetical protein
MKLYCGACGGMELFMGAIISSLIIAWGWLRLRLKR